MVISNINSSNIEIFNETIENYETLCVILLGSYNKVCTGEYTWLSSYAYVSWLNYNSYVQVKFRPSTRLFKAGT